MKVNKGLIILFFVIFISGCSKNAGGIFQVVTIDQVIKNTSLTIKNGTNQSVNLAGWKLIEIRQIIASPSDTNIYIIPSGILAKGSVISFTASSMQFVLGADETVYLYNNTGNQVSQMYWMFFTP